MRRDDVPARFAEALNADVKREVAERSQRERGRVAVVVGDGKLALSVQGVEVSNGIHYHYFGESPRLSRWEIVRLDDLWYLGVSPGPRVSNCNCLNSTLARADRHHN